MKLNLVDLTGTDKQVVYAGGIRLNKLEKMKMYLRQEKLMNFKFVENIIETAEKKITGAQTWIRLHFECKKITDLINTLGIEASTDTEKLTRLKIEIEIIFKAAAERKKLFLEAEKMITGAAKNHYSRVYLRVLLELVACRSKIAFPKPAKVKDGKLAAAKVKDEKLADEKLTAAYKKAELLQLFICDERI